LSYLVENQYDAYARVLTDGLQDVFEELHAIDPVDLVTHVRLGEYAAIEDLLLSSTELFFREGSLTFAWTASARIEWGNVPAVTLGMEFTHMSVSVFFDLSLRAMDQVVSIGSILFDPECHEPQERLKRLTRAVADAHLPRLAGRA
jgi:hypothetical protein